MLFGVHNVDFELVDVLDDPAFLGPIPKRREFGRRRLDRLLEMRAVSHQELLRPLPETVARALPWSNATPIRVSLHQTGRQRRMN